MCSNILSTGFKTEVLFVSVSGNSYEVMETRFEKLNDLPNGTTAQCLASYKGHYGNVYWTNVDCNSNLPFICQHGKYSTHKLISCSVQSDNTSAINGKR